jgi:hypothetical protein
MKKILNPIKHWIMFWISALVIIFIWIFAYNQDYTPINYVSSWSILTSDIFNQLLINVESLKDENIELKNTINTLSWTTKMIVPDYTNMETINRIPFESLQTGRLVSRSKVGNWTADKNWFVYLEWIAKWWSWSTNNFVNIRFYVNSKPVIGGNAYPNRESNITNRRTIIPISDWDTVEIEINYSTGVIQPINTYCYFIPPKIVTLSE